ncbi:hypothetical protein BURPS406E_H0564 [Burkholderia pseudomallei 406e]|nr:hypothetical protein BURPS406E_H0564 [Burkholderia pseudomallei 406e]
MSFHRRSISVSLRRRGGRLCSNVRTLEQGARRITAPPRPFERPGPVTRRARRLRGARPRDADRIDALALTGRASPNARRGASGPRA